MRSPLTNFAMALLTTAFLWPTEDAVNGGGLHLVILWLTLGGLIGLRYFIAARSNLADSPQRAGFGLADFGVLLIVIGHVVSTAYVFHVEGDRRAALNLTFEWAGLYVAWRIFRQLSLDRLQAVQTLHVVITISVGLAVMGIWQHHVFYPEQAAWYQGERSALDKALSEPEGMGLFRVSEIVARFQSKGIPLDGTDRVLWENRLLSSSEPFATFSLANTLAGVLATSFVLVLGQAGWGPKFGSPRKAIGMMITLLQAALILYCLVLTKSRSAWAGAATGMGIVAICRFRTSAAMKILHWSFWGAAFVGSVVGIAAFSGALDKEVIFESSRSLQFRLFYWTGAIETIKEAPLTGAGPGNFRQVYLKYKADESSEEIRDPHNFLLESWSAAGIFGFVGLLMYMYGAFHKAIPAGSALSVNIGTKEIVVPKSGRYLVLKSVVLGAIVHLSWQWINGESVHLDLTERLLPFSGLIFCAMGSRGKIRDLDRSTCLAASVAMMVHLLAAGGFEMPVVMLLLLIMSSFGQLENKATDLYSMPLVLKNYWMVPGISVCFLTAAVVLRYGLMDVSRVDRYVLLGDDLLHRQGNLREALVTYRKAEQSDEIAVSPRQRIAELSAHTLREDWTLLQRLQSGTQSLNDDKSLVIEQKAKAEKSFENALEACSRWISADKRNSFSVGLTAQCLVMGAQIRGEDALLGDAVKLQQNVVAMYPSSIEAWLQLVKFSHQFISGSGRTTEGVTIHENAKKRVRQLDEINHQWGHRDRFLSKDDQALVQDVNSAQPGSLR